MPVEKKNGGGAPTGSEPPGGGGGRAQDKLAPDKLSQDRLPVWQVWADPRREEAAEPLIYSAPEPLPPPRPSREKPPQDYINCLNRHPRLVAACMQNCWLPHYCKEFHKFFDKRGITPIEYFNRDGIGAKAMRRIVFDCDRCGRRDVDPVFSRHSREGQTDEFLLELEARTTLVESAGYVYEDIGEVVFGLLEQLERQRSWHHFCDRCFGKMTDNLAQIMNVTRAKSEPAANADGSLEAPAEIAPRKLKKVAAAG